ncbi:hypothetical protein FOCC_FOCC002181 [Frankliniella occidentalis]|nr:hypothetical protein FOCC_FOCC002181 [Frankliniella occidentalis]
MEYCPQEKALPVMDTYCPLEATGPAGVPDDALRTFIVSKLALDVTVCALILAGNALTICALLHQRWCRRETLCPRFKVSSLFVMNLAVADFLIGCSVLFFLVSHYVCAISEYMSRHRFFCLFKTATFMFSGVISVTTLAAISIDRYVAVQRSSIKSMRAVVLVVGCYVVCYVPFMALFGARLMGLRGPGLDLAFQCLCSVANLNPMLNPFIYSWKNASVRTALRQFMDKVMFLLGVHDGPDAIRKLPAGSSTTATSLSGGGGSGSGVAVISTAKHLAVAAPREKYVPYENVI